MKIKLYRYSIILLTSGLFACSDPVTLDSGASTSTAVAEVVEGVPAPDSPASAIPGDGITEPLPPTGNTDAGETVSPIETVATVAIEPETNEPVGPAPANPEPTDLTTDSATDLASGGEQPVDPDLVQPVSDPWWMPKATDKLKWQWQLQGDVDTTLPVDVYNVDIEIPQNKLDELLDRDIKVICYFSAGTVESFRADAGQFAQNIIGEQYEDLIDEQWVDYANIDALAPIMRARLDKCKSKGFHAVEIDNVDAHNYESRDEFGNVVNIGTNFQMTLDESIAYVLWLAEEAHSRGLSIGLKNAEEMVADVVDVVDWMLVEDCYFDSWCNAATGFIDANKPVFMAEYDELVPDFAPACELARALGFSAIWRDTSLANGVYLACEL